MALAEEVAAVDDLVHGLVEVDGLPPVLAPLAGALEHFAQAIGIVQYLDAALPFGADRGVHLRGLVESGRFGQRQQHVLRAVRIALDLHQHAVLDLALDGTGVVAVQTDAVNDVFGIAEAIGIAVATGENVLHVGQGAHQYGGPTGSGRDLEKIAAG